MRNLKEDKKICEAATAGPWYWKEGELFSRSTRDLIPVSCSDGDFIIEAREGWTHAIERAIAAESKLEVAIKALEQGGEVLRELHSQIGQDIDIDINPSAKRVYLSKVEYVGNTLLLQSLDEINKISVAIQAKELERCKHGLAGLCVECIGEDVLIEGGQTDGM